MVESNPLPPAQALPERAKRLCIGLEHGNAEILELVTPTTGKLLRWWFGEDACASRAMNFHAGQRQAILKAIVAHEIAGDGDLKQLYEQVCAVALLEDGRLDEIAVCAELFAPPAYREQVAQFVRGNVCRKEEIGLKASHPNVQRKLRAAMAWCERIKPCRPNNEVSAPSTMRG